MGLRETESLKPNFEGKFLPINPITTESVRTSEIWFSILSRKLLKRGYFLSVADLKAKVLAFIDYFNRSMAKPFRWTFLGKPLAA